MNGFRDKLTHATSDCKVAKPSWVAIVSMREIVVTFIIVSGFLLVIYRVTVRDVRR